MCKVLGFTKEEKRELKFELEKTALHCSHAIVAARYTAECGHHGLSWMSRIGNDHLLVVATSMNNK